MCSKLRLVLWMVAVLTLAYSHDAAQHTRGVAAVSSIALPQTVRLDARTTRSLKLSPRFIPIDAAPELGWHSDTPQVASVDASGTVHAVAPGKAKIEVSTRDGAQRAQCTVYVFAQWIAQDFEDGTLRDWDVRPHNVAVVDCELGDHIHPLGWAYEVGGQPKSHPAQSSARSGWREHGSHGPGADMAQRQHGYTLSDGEADGFTTRARVFADYQSGQGWEPSPGATGSQTNPQTHRRPDP